MGYYSYQPQDEFEQKPKNHTGRNVVIVLVVLILMVGAGFGGAVAGGSLVYQTMQAQLDQALAQKQTSGLTYPANNPPTQTQTKLTISSTEIQTTITQVVEAVGPAVVTVLTTIPDRRSGFRIIPGGTSSGSGVIISADGYILTNNHVVEGGSAYAVILANGQEKSASLIGTDAYSDLAVLKVEGEMPAVAVLGNSNMLKRGETVIAIGSPLGDFKNSVTVGVVSATGRSLDTGDGYTMDGLIQTDAAINQGNSGGPLINLAGQVIGINTMIVRSSGSSTVVEGLGFAVPSSTSQDVASRIIEKGFVTRPYVGVTTQSIDPSLARRFGLPVQWGAYVMDVDAGSPATKAGIQEGDIIIKVGSITLDETHLYLNALFNYSPGETIKIVVMRGTREIEFDVKLAATTG